MRRGDFTVILARYGAGGAKKYTFSRKFLIAGTSLVLIVFSAFSLTAFHYFHMWKRTTTFEALLSEADRLRRENASFRVTARQLTDRMTQLETTAKKLEMMAGAVDEGRTGVGGPLSDDPAWLELDEPQALKRHFNSLDRKRISLQDELNRLQEYYTRRSILMAAAPSILPASGYMGDGYAWRKDPFTGKRQFHSGLDIEAPAGMQIVASADGTVSYAGWKGDYGKMVEIQHRFGLSTRYAHMSKVVAKPGQKVKRGDLIGFVGSTGRATGSHCHFEVRLFNDTLDPLRFVRQ